MAETFLRGVAGSTELGAVPVFARGRTLMQWRAVPVFARGRTLM
ncbi:MAG: hypothetical protein O7B79_08735 [SAR324 cluster bacterium]|nr:hypothetical protein [SAR324 cluster bacterium]